MQNRFYDLNTYFRRQFGCRVHKLTVDAGMTCPNRDGTVGRGGCIYCNASGSGTAAHNRGLTITQQLEAAKTAVIRRFKAKKFLAYFQSFSNTYAPVRQLQELYDEALAVSDVVGLSIGTRPDCVDEDKLALLERYAQTHLIWIEYGLQSSHDRTLAAINRGHDVGAFERAIAATADRGIRICVHAILGLPGEDADQIRATADYIARLPIDGLKLHLLYVVRGTAMEDLYRSGRYQCLEREEYAERVCDFIERIPGRVVIQRLTGDPHWRELVAPLWALEKANNLDLIKQKLTLRDTWQGKFCISVAD